MYTDPLPMVKPEQSDAPSVGMPMWLGSCPPEAEFVMPMVKNESYSYSGNGP